MDSTEFMESLSLALSNTAEWRRQKAVEYPSDDRNLPAADRLEKLAAGVDALRSTDMWMRYLKVWDLGDYDTTAATEIELEAIKRVGFHSFPDTATTFLSDLVEELERKATDDDETEMTGMHDMFDAIEDVIVSAAPEKQSNLRKAIDGYNGNFPEEFNWAISGRAPALLHSLMWMLHEVTHRDVPESPLEKNRDDLQETLDRTIAFARERETTNPAP